MTTRAKRPLRNESEFAALLEELRRPDDAAELRHLVELCQRSTRVRAWLFGRFANERDTQAAFRRLLNGTGGNDPDASPWSLSLSRHMRLQSAPAGEGADRHGGLTEAQVLALIKHYQSDKMDLVTFLLVRCWQRFWGSDGMIAPVALWQPTLRHWAAIARDSSGRLARQLATTLRFFHERTGQPIGEADFGFPNAWKIHVLVYVLDHPQSCYRVGELRAHLPAKYAQVQRKEVRRFCKLHGIERDVNPGERPGTRSHRRRGDAVHSGRVQTIRGDRLESPGVALNPQFRRAEIRRNLTAERKE